MSDPRARLYAKRDKASAAECGISSENEGEVRNYSVTSNRPPARAGATEDPRMERNRVLDELHARRNQEIYYETRGIQQSGEGLLAHREFNTLYPDIAQDDELNRLAAEADRVLVTAGDQRPAAQRYRSIGNRVREAAADPSLRDAIRQFGIEPAGQFIAHMQPIDREYEQDTSAEVREMAEARRHGRPE
jgi:hypothetical protein